MLLLHLLLAFAVPQAAEVPRDTAQALEQASLLIYRHYESLDPNNREIIPCRRGQEDGACVDERANPLSAGSSVPWASACQGPDFAECFAGDWDCAGPVRGDCLQPHVRLALIERLEELAPEGGDAIWLFQQRVGMTVKQGDFERAREVARECGAIDWFCPALRGFVEHRIQLGTGTT